MIEKLRLKNATLKNQITKMEQQLQQKEEMGEVGPLNSIRLGLDTVTVELTVKHLLRHLVTREFNSPANSLRTPYALAEP
eukprot:32043-Pyramimonas_sp.AAC.1